MNDPTMARMRLQRIVDGSDTVGACSSSPYDACGPQFRADLALVLHALDQRAGERSDASSFTHGASN